MESRRHSRVHDENLRFASGDTVQRGWQQTLERYQKHYDTREKMGTLSFQDLEIPLSGTTPDCSLS